MEHIFHRSGKIYPWFRWCVITRRDERGVNPCWKLKCALERWMRRFEECLSLSRFNSPFFLADCVKTNTSDIVIPTKVGIQLILAGYGSPVEFTPRKRGGDDTPQWTFQTVYRKENPVGRTLWLNLPPRSRRFWRDLIKGAARASESAAFCDEGDACV